MIQVKPKNKIFIEPKVKHEIQSDPMDRILELSQIIDSWSSDKKYDDWKIFSNTEGGYGMFGRRGELNVLTAELNNIILKTLNLSFTDGVTIAYFEQHLKSKKNSLLATKIQSLSDEEFDRYSNWDDKIKDGSQEYTRIKRAEFLELVMILSDEETQNIINQICNQILEIKDAPVKILESEPNGLSKNTALEIKVVRLEAKISKTEAIK